MSDFMKLKSVMEEAVMQAALYPDYLSPIGQIDWPSIENWIGSSWVGKLSECPQNDEYHAEGDVWTHTKMVVEEMIKQPGYINANKGEKHILFISALLHDLGKPLTTKIENGWITSKGHSKTGSIDARILLWKKGYDFHAREMICRLVANHQVPFFLFDRDDSLFKIKKLSHELRLDFLYLLSKADNKGRITNPKALQIKTDENLDLFKEFCLENNCFDVPYKMADKYTAFKYFNSNGSISSDHAFYENEGSKVYLLAGLPASGKSTVCKTELNGLEVVSYDEMREGMGLKHGKNSGEVTHAVLDRVKELLRSKTSFVWDATHLSSQMRGKALGLLHNYNAAVEIIYCETDYHELLSRNSKRDSSISNKVIEDMLYRWEVPLPTEAKDISYKITYNMPKNKNHFKI